jgi:hypothetical protein
MFWIKMILGLQDVRTEVMKFQKLGVISQVLLSRKFWSAVWILAGYALRQFKGVEIDTNHWLEVTMEIVSYVIQIFGITLAGASVSDSITVKPPEVKDERGLGAEPKTGIDKSF